MVCVNPLISRVLCGTNWFSHFVPEFHNLDKEVLMKALRILQSQKKAELIKFDDSEGVKFF